MYMPLLLVSYIVDFGWIHDVFCYIVLVSQGIPACKCRDLSRKVLDVIEGLTSPYPSMSSSTGISLRSCVLIVVWVEVSCMYFLPCNHILILFVLISCIIECRLLIWMVWLNHPLCPVMRWVDHTPTWGHNYFPNPTACHSFISLVAHSEELIGHSHQFKNKYWFVTSLEDPAK